MSTSSAASSFSSSARQGSTAASSSAVAPAHRELYARVSVALGTARHGSVLPHAAARATRLFLASRTPEALANLSVDEIAAAALAEYEGSGASSRASPPSSPQRAAADEAGRTAVLAGRTLSHDERRQMLEAYGRTMLSPKAAAKTRLEPADLVWSPMKKQFSAPPRSKLHAPTAGLWVDLTQLDTKKGEEEREAARARKAAMTDSFRLALDEQMAERTSAAAQALAQRVAAAEAAAREKAALLRDARSGGRAKLLSKAGESRAAAGEMADLLARKKREAAAASAAARIEADKLQAAAQKELDAKAAKAATKRAEIASFMAQNEADLAAKKRLAVEEKREMAEHARATMERMTQVESQRKADTTARLAAIEAKMAQMSGVLEAAVNNDAKLEAKADVERKREEAEADARAAARLRAHRELEAACSSTMRLQMQEKHANERARAAEARLLQAELAQQARDAAQAEAATLRRRREAALLVQLELQKQILQTATRIVSPDVTRFERTFNAELLEQGKQL